MAKELISLSLSHEIIVALDGTVKKLGYGSRSAYVEFILKKHLRELYGVVKDEKKI